MVPHEHFDDVEGNLMKKVKETEFYLDAGSSILSRPQETTMPRVVEGSVESMDPVRHPCAAAATPPSPALLLLRARSPEPAIDLPRALSPWPPSPARYRTLGEMPPPPPNFSSCARFFRTRTRPLPSSSRQIFLPLPRTAPTSAAREPETRAQLRVLTRRLQIRIPSPNRSTPPSRPSLPN